MYAHTRILISAIYIKPSSFDQTILLALALSAISLSKLHICPHKYPRQRYIAIKISPLHKTRACSLRRVLVQATYVSTYISTWVLYMNIAINLSLLHKSRSCSLRRVFVRAIYIYTQISSSAQLIYLSIYTHTYPYERYIYIAINLWPHNTARTCYGVASISRILKIIGLFCKRSL